MPWGRLDDSFYDHPKLDELGRDRLACVGLWTVCISWSNRHLTDGYLPSERIVRLGGTVHLAEQLVRVGLFDTAPDGFLIHDFLAFNESKAQVESRRESDRTRWRNRRDSGPTPPRSLNGHRPDSERPVLSRPVLTIPVPPDAGAKAPVDEREWTEEQRQSAYVAEMERRL